MKARLYIYVHARRTGAIPGGPIDPRNPSDCADAVIYSHGAERTWETNKKHIREFIEKPELQLASATTKEGMPSPFDVRGDKTPLHTLTGETGRKACARFITAEGYVTRTPDGYKPLKNVDTISKPPEAATDDDSINVDQIQVDILYPDEAIEELRRTEGATRQVTVNAFERDRENRRKCIDAHGTTCCICDFNFGAVYGPEAEGYIHVHHIRPLSEMRAAHLVDPVNDLRPVCPNCHAVIHLCTPCRSIEDARQLLNR